RVGRGHRHALSGDGLGARGQLRALASHAPARRTPVQELPRLRKIALLTEPARTRKSFTALVMAGSRAGRDPLAAASGVTHKALTPVAGMAMLARVVRTLRATGRVERIVVSGLEADAAGDLGIAAGPDGVAVELVRGDRTPSESVAL